MSVFRRLILRFMSPKTRARAEAESRAWIATCPACGHERSVWEMGGLRYGASGAPRWRLTCPACGATGWHQVEKRC
ncbi:MAG: hypothetical protein AAGE13_07175 [Pseudomonadota bacterium]